MAYKFNTGNPVGPNGSADPRDLVDNSQVADRLINGSELTVPDRLGVARKTWAGMEQDFQQFLINSGYQFLGDYAAGIEVTAYNQVIRYGGEFWRVATGTSLPYTTTGAGMPEGGAFFSAGDAVLRQELADPDKGAAMVAYQGGSVADKLEEIVSGAVTDPQVDAKVESHNHDADAHPELRTRIVSEVSSHVTAEANRAEAAADASIQAGQWDQEVADAAARLALTGLATNWQVYQLDTEHVWRWDGSAWLDRGPSPLAMKVFREEVIGVLFVDDGSEPLIDYPRRHVLKANGEDLTVYHIPEQLFIAANVQSGKRVNNISGVIETTSGYTCSDYIPVTPGKKYTIYSDPPRAGNAALAFFSSQSPTANVTAGMTGAGDYRTVTAPDGAAFLVFNILTNPGPLPEWIGCIEGDVAPDHGTSRVPKLSMLGGGAREEINSFASILEMTPSQNLLDPARIVDNRYVRNDGSYGPQTGWKVIVLPASEGDVFTINASTARRHGIAFYAANPPANEMECITHNQDAGTVTVTAPAGTASVVFNIQSQVITQPPDLQIVEGPDVKPYIPYGAVKTVVKPEALPDPVPVAEDKKFVAYGDSTTYGSDLATPLTHRWSKLLGDLLGTEIVNRGEGGLVSNEVAWRAGSAPMRCLVADGVIPASGAVEISIPTMFRARIYGAATLYLRDGTTVSGNLSSFDGKNYFTRSVAGSAIAHSGYVQIKSNFSEGVDYARDVLICAAGVNDVPLIVSASRTVDDVKAHLRYIMARASRSAFWSLLDRGLNEAPGTPRGNVIAEVNTWLKEELGVRYIDLHGYLTSPEALLDALEYDDEFTPTSDDLAAQSAGAVPPSFRVGGTSVHLTEMGHWLQAQYMAQHLRTYLPDWLPA